jgi:hypothetical protein
MIEVCKDIISNYWMVLFVVLFLAGVAVWLAYGAGKQVEKDKRNKHLMDRHYADREKAKMEGDGT